MRNYDAAAVLGTAYDFERQCYPDHLYRSLRAAAQMYNSGRAMGGIAVCGAAEMKALERGQRAPTTEAQEMERYLITALNIPASVIHVEDQSTNTPENFVNLKAIATAQGWRQIYMPIAEPRIERAAFLGQKVCYGQSDFTMEGVEPDRDKMFRTEEKLRGDTVCALQDMEWGDDEYLLKADRTSRWDEIRKGHYICEYYVPTSDVECGVAEPFKNFHPETLMAAHGNVTQ